jgi:hypothetical protein
LLAEAWGKMPEEIEERASEEWVERWRIWKIEQQNEHERQRRRSSSGNRKGSLI